MSKHTPGPWEYDKRLACHGEKWSEVNGRSKLLCEPICIVPHDDVSDEGYVEVVANIRLIAAAPELLNALEDFVKACNIPGDTKLGVEVEMAFRQADALLEKLKGETNG